MPTIDKSNFNDMNSFMGQPFIFEAMISDNPQINYECRKNGKLIDQSLDKITVNRVGKKFILYIKSVDESHAGLYSLISSNSNARDEASFNLTVLPVQNSSANLSVNSYFLFFIFYLKTFENTSKFCNFFSLHFRRFQKILLIYFFDNFASNNASIVR
jgi:hypothetical protein